MDRRQVLIGSSRLSYDTLIVAVGSQPNYFGKAVLDAWLKEVTFSLELPS